MFVSRLFLRTLNCGAHRFSVNMSRLSSISYTLSFDAYDAYGFDIDHTLSKYNLPRLFTVRLRFFLMTDRHFVVEYLLFLGNSCYSISLAYCCQHRIMFLTLF